MTPLRGIRPTLVVGLLTCLVGLALVTGAGLYYTYSLYASSNLEHLSVPESEVARALSEKPPRVEPTVFAPPRSKPTQAPPPNREPPASLDTPVPAGPSQPAPAVFPASAYETVYPGLQLHPKYWAEPLWAGSDPYPHVATGLPSGFRSVPSDSPASPASFGTMTRMAIPIIGVDSGIEELEIVDLGDSRAYENPDNIVGHIPQTAAPGEVGNGWFFGHLESPVRGEGNVFRRLPDIPGYLRDGDPVYVSLESDAGTHLYQVTATAVVHQDEIHLYGADEATITLVSCVPRLVYDHRLLVTAKLVGVGN